MPVHYRSGAEIKKGDRVLFHGEPGQVELVADPLVDDSETAWYVQEFGGGVLLSEPKTFGRVFLSLSDLPEAEDLEFVSRATDKRP